MRSIIIDPAEKKVEVVDLKRTREDDSYKELVDVIGGFIDATYVTLPDGRDITVYVDDEGLLKGLFKFGFGNGIQGQETFAGKAVVIGLIDDEGYDTPLPEDITPETLGIKWKGLFG